MVATVRSFKGLKLLAVEEWHEVPWRRAGIQICPTKIPKPRSCMSPKDRHSQLILFKLEMFGGWQSNADVDVIAKTLPIDDPDHPLAIELLSTSHLVERHWRVLELNHKIIRTPDISHMPFPGGFVNANVFTPFEGK